MPVDNTNTCDCKKQKVAIIRTDYPLSKDKADEWIKPVRDMLGIPVLIFPSGSDLEIVEV